MTDVFLKKTLSNQSSLKIKEDQKENHGGHEPWMASQLNA